MSLPALIHRLGAENVQVLDDSTRLLVDVQVDGDSFWTKRDEDPRPLARKIGRRVDKTIVRDESLEESDD